LSPVKWLEEAYKDPIDLSDTGYVARNLFAARTLSLLLRQIDPMQTYCDYGAGYGLLVRLMRDRGFRFHWHDPFCQNLFAQCLGASREFMPYEVVTAFEVFEHLPSPAEGLAAILQFGRTVVFTTELCPEPKPTSKSWSYLGLEHGQHLSFYTERSLQALASRFGLVYRNILAHWHVIGPSEQALSIAAAYPRFRPLRGVRLLMRGRASLLKADHEGVIRAQRVGTLTPNSFNLDSRMNSH
jgi:hypothetical protein